VQGGPSCSPLARPFRDSHQQNDVVAESHRARIERADHFPVVAAGRHVLGAEKQMGRKPANHRGFNDE
jgi:hypothetical protein